MKKAGSITEEEDTGAYLWWRYKNATKEGGAPSDWKKAAANYRINFSFPTEVPNDDILVVATHKAPKTDANPAGYDPNDSVNLTTDENIYEREEIPFCPLNSPILNLTNDSASLAYSGTTKINDDDKVSTTAEVWFNGAKVTSGVTYAWTLKGCKDKDGKDSVSGATVTIKTLSENTASATCTASYKGATFTKVFTITRQLKGDPGSS
jgi:hypothetical protein